MLSSWLNKIHLGDCTKLLKSLPSDSIDLVVTSPPYNIGKQSNYGFGVNGKNHTLNESYDKYKDNMPEDAYIQWQRRIISEILRVLKNTGALFYNHKHFIKDGLRKKTVDKIVEGFPERQQIIWARKRNANFTPTNFAGRYEIIYLICHPDFRLDGEKTVDGKAIRNLGDVWFIDYARNNPHPASFPEELVYRCISSNSSQVVLDPFMGSGTTGWVAKKLGRDFIGFEISEEYVQMAERNIGGYNSVQTELFG